MSRVEKLRNCMKELEVDGYFVTTLQNVRYLTGFTGTTGVAFVTANEQFFITDFRYREQATEQCKNFDVIIHQAGVFQELACIIDDLGLQRIAIEADEMNVATYQQLQSILNIEIVPTSGVIEKIREVKDASEIKIIRQAIEIADQAYEHILTFIKPGITEIQVANELDFYMRSLGASGVSFDTIVASGVRSSMPHGVASQKVIESGDLITLDFGCYYEGYVSDMTRTIALGTIDPKLKEIYEIVLRANEIVNENTKAGITGKQMDALARDYITQKGYGDDFGHSTGHGIGLDIHEGPSISFRNEEPLVVNNIVTNEPGIYLAGLGGVRIEDDLLIQEGGVEILNHSPKELIIL